MKLIKLTRYNGVPIVMNADKILAFIPLDGGYTSVITGNGECGMEVKESPAAIEQLIRIASEV